MRTDLTPQVVEIATEAWLVEWRRAWVKRNPGKECPALPWVEYEPATQMLMMRAVKAALIAAEPEKIREVLERREA